MKQSSESHINSSSGIATIPVVIIFTFLVLVVGVAIALISSNETFDVLFFVNSSKALNYAQTGAKDALIKITRNKDFSFPSPSYNIEFATNGCTNYDGCATVTVTTNGNNRTITSQGRSKNSIRRIQVDITLSTYGEITSSTSTELTN